MSINHVHTRQMLAALAVLPLLAVAACSSGDDDDRADVEQLSDSTEDATSASPTTQGGAPSAAACSPEEADVVGDGFDKAACVSLGAGFDDLVRPTLVDGRVWAWVDQDHFAAYDAATGAEVFRADKPEGAFGINSMAVIEVDGKQMVAASVAVSDPGDAVNAPSEGWRLLAWPADAAKESPEPAIDAYVKATEGSVDLINSETFWGTRGVQINQYYLRYDATEFVTYKLPEEYPIPGSIDPTPPEPFYVGTSQDVALGYIEGVEVVDVGVSSVAGFFAADATGKVLWDHLSITPGDDLVIGYEGPTHVKAVWGDYALDITMDESGDGGEVNWYDAATGVEATPKPDELAAANARGFEDVMVTPDGKYLAFSAYNADMDATRNFILDVASGKLTRIDSENELSASSMIGTTLYVTGGADAGGKRSGAAVVDLTTGKATAMQSGTAPIAVSEGFGVFTTVDAAVVAPTS